MQAYSNIADTCDHGIIEHTQISLTSLTTAGLPIRWTLGRRWDDFITRSDFKSETIFGFLSPNYTGQHAYFFGKSVASRRCFPEGFCQSFDD